MQKFENEEPKMMQYIYFYKLKVAKNLVKMPEFVMNNSINVSKLNLIITFSFKNQNSFRVKTVYIPVFSKNVFY